MRRLQKSCGRILLGLFWALTALFLPNAWSMHEGIPCYSCHVREAGKMGGEPSDDQRLPSSTICFSCHDAKQDTSGLNPPYVLNATMELAGGSFTPTLSDDATGHNVLSTDTILGFTPPGGIPMREFGCLSCHDAHDNGNYRSLKKEINGYFTLVEVRGDPNYQENFYISGINQFCGACHEKFYGQGNLREGERWVRHPVGITISGANHADFDKWSRNKNRVTLVENPTGNANDVRSAQVFCLSCHRAHASPFGAAMRWDYRQTTTGCLECHSSVYRTANP